MTSGRSRRRAAVRGLSVLLIDVTGLGLVGEAPARAGGETPRVADSSAAQTQCAVVSYELRITNIIFSR